MVKTFVVVVILVQATCKDVISPGQRVIQAALRIQNKTDYITRENFQQPASGTERDYDLRLPYLLPLKKLPELKFNTKTTLILNDFILRWIFRILGKTATAEEYVTKATKNHKFQVTVPDEVPFPCPTEGTRSVKRPNSADCVRPGDIDVVVALGDSLTAGNGIASTFILQVLVTNRGISYAGGGQGTWRQFMTVPNILKEFNPNLVGYALGDTLYNQEYQNQQFNLAEPAAIVDDMLMEARTTVYKLRRDPRVNFEQDWKLVTILIGSVDFCLDLCFWKRPQDAPAHFSRKLKATLDYLMENQPRTIVNFMISPHIPRFLRSHRFGRICRLRVKMLCPCIFGDTFRKFADEYDTLIDKVLDAELKVVEDEKYKAKSDFRIITLPFLRNVTAPLLPPDLDGSSRTDMRYLAADCFHLSQRSHAAVSTTVWNSLLTPRSKRRKELTPIIHEKLICPSGDHAFFAT